MTHPTPQEQTMPTPPTRPLARPPLAFLIAFAICSGMVLSALVELVWAFPLH